ncbi:hypothetical protein [Aphanothece minutissima]|jgi:hypothetical protein|uniref:Uncharacterized protein n=1 Tax=Aphanothece cf. minutissima CCALA 015 TaxID=2107695 RepID=A0ABX5FA34_9CHRO|nr:hypothetical protein [Aphanothece minutissima]PSB38545.1 hypothetical protein C7B81_02935 [Aphanothece cf. minutissima CCALA 015]
MGILRAATTYFALVFGTGFVLGAVRVPLLVPRLGERLAELLEMPWMALAMVLAARLVVRRQLAGRGPLSRAAAGALALAFMLAAELVVGLLLQQRPLQDILTGRDPIAGGVYLALLLLYALLPLLLGRGSTTTAVP